MPERATLRRAQRDQRMGKAPSTQAGEFIREEIHHIRERKHGARSSKQAIAIGLSKARRAGVDLKPPAAARSSATTRRKAERDYERGHDAAPARRATAKRRRASTRALKHEGRAAASPRALSAQARAAARRRGSAARSAAASKAVRTKGAAGRSPAAHKPARSRGQHARVRGASRELHA
jgi:hypothetical protein